MKKSIALIVLIAASLAMSVRTPAAQEGAGPRIRIPQERFDLGRVVPGGPVEHIFEIRNDGDETLVIERIKTS